MGSLNLVASSAGSDALALWVDAAVVAGAVTGATTEEGEQAAQIATDVLYALSGRQFSGVRESTLRVEATTTGPRVPLPVAAPWAAPVSRIGGGCCASGYDPLLYPVLAVDRLTIGGIEVPAEQISVEGQRTVHVLPGTSTTSDPLAVNYYLGADGAYSLWPGSCGCARPAIELTLTWGRDAPAGGLAAAKVFAVELLKAIRGDQGCRLPGNLININRQGVSIVLDPATFLDKKRTGIPLADTWLAAVNPAGLKAAPLLWWADSPLPEVVG